MPAFADMTMWVVTMAAVMAVCAVAHAAAPTTQPTVNRRLRVATYNVEDLFDVFDNPYTADQWVKPKPPKQIAEVAAAIRKLNADVVAITEVENEGVLRAMVRDYLPKMGYRYVAVDQSNSPTGGSDGIISRLPIERTSSYRFRKLHLPGFKKTWHFVRDVMQVKLATGTGKPLQLFIVHFKARRKSPGDPKSFHWRLAEAVGARQIVDAQFQRSSASKPWIVVLGDFNATPPAKPVHVMLGKDGPRSERLFDVHAGLPAAKRITYLLPPYRSTIDYIMVSRALEKRVVKGSATVLHDAALLGGSDHAPIAVTFELGKGVKQKTRHATTDQHR